MEGLETPSKTEDLWWLFTRQTIKVTPRQSVLSASMIMQRRNFRHLPVVDEKGRIMGMISAQDIIDSLNFVLSRPDLMTKEVIESLEIPVERIMVYNSICVEPGDGLAEITKKMTFHNLGGMPVVDEQGVVRGIITLRDLVGLMGTSSDEVGVRVSEIMNPNVITIGQNEYLSTAVRLMSEHRVRRLPVVPGGKGADAGVPKGILSNKDALGRLAKVASVSLANPKGGAAVQTRFDTPISDFMTRDVITVSQDDDIRVAASKMMIFGIGGLVVDDSPTGRVALVTERDLIRTLSRKKGNTVLMNALQFELEVEKANARSSSAYGANPRART
ncbi:MAG TPA: CBS domain-containing protein [Nitrososphaerales archaeon]|nr:CBS domain-containing protein [Nitrososphaerales archaeon]